MRAGFLGPLFLGLDVAGKGERHWWFETNKGTRHHSLLSLHYVTRPGEPMLVQLVVGPLLFVVALVDGKPCPENEADA